MARKSAWARRATAVSVVVAACSGSALAFALSPSEERRRGGSPEAAAAIANAVQPVADEPKGGTTFSDSATPVCKVAKPGEPFEAFVDYESNVSGFSNVFPVLSDRRRVVVAEANKSGRVVVHWAIPFAHLRKKVTLNIKACDQEGADEAIFSQSATRPAGNTNAPVRVRRVQFIWVTRGAKEISHSVKDLWVIPKATQAAVP